MLLIGGSSGTGKTLVAGCPYHCKPGQTLPLPEHLRQGDFSESVSPVRYLGFTAVGLLTRGSMACCRS